MKEWVVVLVKHGFQMVFVVKDKPEWMVGRINLPGGKMEPGESAVDCAARELKEETGFDLKHKPTYMGKLMGGWGIVHCLRAEMQLEQIKPREGETEKPFWSHWEDVKSDVRLIPNLKIIVPLICANMRDWIVYDEGFSVPGNPHQVAVTV